MNGLIIALIIVGIIVLLLILFMAMYNKIYRSSNKVEESKSNLDIYLRKRWDLIPNIVNTVKGYAKHESSVLEEITKMRSTGYNENLSLEEQAKISDKTSQLLTKLMAVSEQYPELKADSMFLDLSSQLQRIEEDLANARAYYNARVRIFNNLIGVVPNCFFASMFKFKPYKYFETTEESKENVKVEF